MIGRLEAALKENPPLCEILRRFDEVDLPEGWLVAGAVAQTVWNLSAGYPADRGIKDADIVYYDATDLSEKAEAAHEARIRTLFAHLPLKFDVKNEARVHLWYENVFGYPIEPYISVASAIASFPTTATSIGVRRRASIFECFAPFGLDDLFGLVVRPNKVQIRPHIFLGSLAFGIVGLAAALPFSPVAAWLGFVGPSAPFFLYLAGAIVAYLALVEAAKLAFYKLYARQTSREISAI